MDLKEFFNYVGICKPDGSVVPFILNKQQKEFVDFIQWCKDNGYQTDIPYGCRGRKELFNNLWEKYKEQK